MKTLLHTIVKSFLLFTIFSTIYSASAQAPNKMSYQAVVRNTANALVANANVGIQISILQTSTTGTAVFVERHTVTTNINGLATIEIGGGTLVSGNFTTIDWANGPYFIKTQTDPTGGTNYTISGISQLLSVPFALFAASTGPNLNSWGTNGNAATATHFIGTTNDTDVVFKRNGIVAGRIANNRFDENGITAFGLFALSSNVDESGIANTAFGTNTLKDNTRGSFNVAVGSDALSKNTTGLSNTAIGSKALFVNVGGSDNIAIGAFALRSNTTGSSNVAIGVSALGFNDTGSGNTATGLEALGRNTRGLSNTATGHRALNFNSDGNSNTAMGASALTANIGGDFNTAIGVEALNRNTFGNNNTASGAFALNSNDRGVNNSAHGREALFSNTGGNRNTANGRGALFTNTLGNDNTAIGESALFGSTTGSNNTATGKDALLANTTGGGNTAQGFQALDANTTGSDNTAMGRGSLTDNEIGVSNTAIGKDALFNSVADNNTALGRGTLSGVTTGSNNTAVGFNAQVASATASNQVRVGNAAVNLASVQVAWTITSDLRWKSNIQKSNLGLDFIKQLNPVFYTRKDVVVDEGKSIISENTTNPVTEYGFIAQELEKTLAKFDTKNNGIISKDDTGMYGVRYNDLIAPMVKAIQEQQAIIEAQAKTIAEILKRLETVETKK